MSFYAGDTFWIVEPNPHLWVIISEPAIDPDQVLYVNFTSFDAAAPAKDAENDRACIVTPGEHPFITQTTCVYYFGAHVSSIAQLEYREQRRELRRDKPISKELLTKIRQCAEKSIHMVPDHWQILIDQGLVE